MPPPDRRLARVTAALGAQLELADQVERSRSAAALAAWRPSTDRPIPLATYLERRGPAAPAHPVEAGAGEPQEILDGWKSKALSDGIGALGPADAGRVVLLDLVNRQLVGAVPIALAAQTEAARALAEVIQERYGGRTLEVRIPLVTAVQLKALGSGPQHSRGTPPNVIELDAQSWVRLGLGFETWSQLRPRVSASGSHVDDIAAMLPIYPAAPKS